MIIRRGGQQRMMMKSRSMHGDKEQEDVWQQRVLLGEIIGIGLGTILHQSWIHFLADRCHVALGTCYFINHLLTDFCNVDPITS